jgi:hypothetical protein
MQLTSSALTVNGNTVLHSGNYNSYAPTLTGGGASGTWGINVTGSAGSAGSASYAGYADRIQTGNNQWIWSNGAHTATNPNTITLWDQYSDYGGAGYLTAYATIVDIYGRSGHEHDQLYFDSSGTIYHRNCFYGTNTWNGWRTIWDNLTLTNLNQLTNGPGYITNTTSVITLTNDSSSRVLYIRGTGNIIQFQDASANNKWEVVGRQGEFYIYKNDGTGSGMRYQIGTDGNHTITGYITANSGITTAASYNASTYNQPAITVNSSGTGSAGSSIAIQQITAEGWTGVFVDFEPNTGWGLYHDNPNNYFCITAEASTGSLRSFAVPSRVSGNRTAYEKIRFDQNNGSILAGGDITAFSDARAKDNIEIITDALSKIQAIRGVTYTKIDSEGIDRNIRHAGVLAQEVLEVLPEVVHEDHNTGMYSVAYGNMAGLFIEAIKEQQVQIESQKSEIEELKDLVKQLINR